jgi:hypothetical protein
MATCIGDLCNGAGACQAQPPSVQCAGATCVGSTFTPARFCDGTTAGVCPAGSPASCSPYVCAGASCGTSCLSTSDCINANYTCTGTAECKLNNGQGCSSGGQCASGFCADGYCCNTSCTQQCKSCNQTGVEGTCTNVPFQDPPAHGICGACGLCGPTGSCCTTLQCQFPNGLCVQ